MNDVFSPGFTEFMPLSRPEQLRLGSFKKHHISDSDPLRFLPPFKRTRASFEKTSSQVMSTLSLDLLLEETSPQKQASIQLRHASGKHQQESLATQLKRVLQEKQTYAPQETKALMDAKKAQALRQEKEKARALQEERAKALRDTEEKARALGEEQAQVLRKQKALSYKDQEQTLEDNNALWEKQRQELNKLLEAETLLGVNSATDFEELEVPYRDIIALCAT
jgi:hypothetical protein